MAHATSTDMPICLFCVTSSRSGIGDGFLSLANAMPPGSNIVVVKGDPYQDAEFNVPSDRILSASFSIRSPLSYLSIRNWKRLFYFLKQHNVDHLFFYSTAPINSLTVMMVRHLSFSLWCHDPLPHPGEPIHIVLPKEIDQRLLFQSVRCKQVFVCSHFLKKLLITHRNVSPSKITCCPLPVIEEITKHAKRIDYKDREFDIIFWGRVETYKGLDVLGNALLRMQKEGHVFKTLIVGRGPLDAFIPTELISSSAVTIKNRYVENAELADDICRSKVAVFPYRSSTGTHTVQTSLALGCRVVASDVGSFRELLTTEVVNAGSLVPPEDPAALADTLMGVLALPDHDPTAAQGFAEQFAPTRWAEAIMKKVRQQ